MTTQTQTITGYRITATYLEGGARVDSADAAKYSADLHTRFLLRGAAEARASALQAEVAGFGLAPSTVYEVEECAAVVSDVEYDADEGVVTAHIAGDGYAGSVGVAVEPRQTMAGIDGLLATSTPRLGAGRRWDVEVTAVMLSMVRTVATARGMEAW